MRQRAKNGARESVHILIRLFMAFLLQSLTLKCFFLSQFVCIFIVHYRCPCPIYWMPRRMNSEMKSRRRHRKSNGRWWF